jgi:hypothetical protein
LISGAGGMGVNSTLSQICKRASGHGGSTAAFEPRSLMGKSK